jgi:hypothetical protein
VSVEVISSVGHRLGYSGFSRVARVCPQAERSEPLWPGVVAEYQAAPHGQKAAVLRREGPWATQITADITRIDALAPG